MASDTNRAVKSLTELAGKGAEEYVNTYHPQVKHYIHPNVAIVGSTLLSGKVKVEHRGWNVKLSKDSTYVGFSMNF